MGNKGKTVIELKQVNPEFWVSAQINQSDLVEIAAKGIKTIICNRPDGEGVDQPNIIEIQEAAIRQGIQLEYLPVVSGRVTDEQAIEFKSLYQKSQKPVLAFCRSGTRSITFKWLNLPLTRCYCSQNHWAMIYRV